MARRRPLTCLMFKLTPTDGAPVLYWPNEADIAFWERLGWTLIITEREIRYADLEDVRREDESRGRPTS